jgi:FkbM family methyltransferase
MLGDPAAATLKAKLQKLLGQAGLYERAKASWVYDLYWNIVDKRIVADRRREVEFYKTLLVGFRKGDLIFDVGANRGDKTDVFLRLGAKVVAVEPDETCEKVLEGKFLKKRLTKKPLSIVRKAVSDTTSTGTLWVEEPGSALNTLSKKWADTLEHDDTHLGRLLSFGICKQVDTVSIEDLIATYSSPFYIKIDVEGHESSVVRGMARPVPYLSFEVNLPEFRPEGLECVRLLATLASESKFNYSADCRRGLDLQRWLGPDEFSVVLGSFNERNIEVFCKTADRRG